MDSKNARNTVRIELTEEQKKQMREQTGQEVDSVEFTVEQLEPRIAPRSIGTFL